MDNSLDAQKSYKNLIWQDPDRQGGAVCFYETRIPVHDLFDWLETGSTMSEFLEAFPQVGIERARSVLELAGRQLDLLLEDAA